jgi:hypothetical protein
MRADPSERLWDKEKGNGKRRGVCQSQILYSLHYFFMFLAVTAHSHSSVVQLCRTASITLNAAWLRELLYLTKSGLQQLLLAGLHTPAKLPYLEKSFPSCLGRKTTISHLKKTKCFDLHQKGHLKTLKCREIPKTLSVFLTTFLQKEGNGGGEYFISELKKQISFPSTPEAVLIS